MYIATIHVMCMWLTLVMGRYREGLRESTVRPNSITNTAMAAFSASVNWSCWNKRGRRREGRREKGREGEREEKEREGRREGHVCVLNNAE